MHQRHVTVLSLLAFLFCASVLRAPITAIPPLAGTIQHDLGMTAAQTGLLTSIPVLCFGLLTPIASWALGRWGLFTTTTVGLGLIIAGSLLRSAGTVPAAYTGTIVIGAGIAVGNLAVPILIARRYSGRAALASGAYAATINVAVTASTAFAVPIALVLGWGWSAALWGVVLGAVTLVLWVAVRWAEHLAPSALAERRAVDDSERARASETATAGTRASNSSQSESDRPANPARLRWLLAAAFTGHTLSYYAVTAWLPTALADMLSLSAADAGRAASLFQAAGIAGPFLVPVLVGAARWSILRTLVVISAGWAVLPVGMIVAPGGWFAWCLISGAAQGAFFTALFLVVIERSRTIDENRRISTTMQTTGYAFAAIGPVLLGWMHSMVPGWTPAFLLIACVVLVMGVCSVAAARVRS